MDEPIVNKTVDLMDAIDIAWNVAWKIPNLHYYHSIFFLSYVFPLLLVYWISLVYKTFLDAGTISWA